MGRLPGFLQSSPGRGAGGFLVFERKLGRERVKSHGKQAILFFGLAAALFLVTSCGSKTSSTTTPTITVSCVPTDVTVLTTSQCTATVLNLSSTLVNWSINPSTAGSIDTQSGLYKAPASVPQNNVVTVTATSQVQSTVTATQNLTIEAATKINAITCVDPISGTVPSPFAVESGRKLDCTASDPNGATVAVTWSVANATSGAGGNIGGISSQGIYTAPPVPPPGGKVTITATSQAVSNITLSTSPLSIVFGSAVLSGNFVFSTSGRLPSGEFWARAGSFSAGGGTLVGNAEDTDQGGSPNVVKTGRTFTGSYSIGPDGRGTMQFCEDTRLTCTPGAATAFFRIVVVSPQQFELIEFSKPNTSSAAAIIAGGEMIQQDSSLLQPGNPPSTLLSGAYSFNFAGISSSGSAESVVGEFSSDGFGHIAAGGASPPTPGAMDIDAGGATLLPATVYSINSAEVGTVTLNGFKFDFYPISSSRAKFIEVDTANSILLGDAYKQQNSSTCGWSTGVALSGSIVLETVGSASGGFAVADVGSFTANSGLVTDVSIDENNAGAYTPPGSSQSGTYAIDSNIKCSRGTLSVPGHSYVFYVVSPSSAVLQETTPGRIASGLLLPAQSGSLADGSYAFRMQGTDAAGAAGQEEDLLGQFTSVTSTGASPATAWNGTLDLNDFGAAQSGLPITNGVYTASSGLRSTATMPIGNPVTTTRNLVLYMVSPTLFYVLDTDTTGTALGTIGNQF